MAKRIGILSDTHGYLPPGILEILKTCDCILHAGDINTPEILDVLRPLASIYAVRGNNDREWAQGLAATLRFTIEDVEFFMMHNKRDVARDLESVQVVIFGHTHKYFESVIDDRLWLNPGCCKNRVPGRENTMILMTVENGSFSYEKVSVS